MTAPTENLLRSVPFTLTRADEEAGDGRTLQGYAAVFDSPTLIDSWEGTFYESIRKGAFRKSLRERTPVMQFDHGRHPLIGSIPIGRITELKEDDHGLPVEARLSDNWLIDPLRQAIADGSVDGMSFRFSVVRDEWRDKDGKLIRDDNELLELLYYPGERGPVQRTLIELKLHELGPVVFPAYADTTVGVRARSVASLIEGDEEMRRKARADLARETAVIPDTETDLADPDMRREVARALLFRGETSDAPPEGHPSAHDTPIEDAPLRDEHPSDDNDAPPADGHPSPDETSQRLRDQIAEVRALMRDVLAPIEQETSNGT